MLILIYVIIAGIGVPLKPGIDRVAPLSSKAGQSIELQVFGYNSTFSETASEKIRVWLEFDSLHAIQSGKVDVKNDTTLLASFQIPARLPQNKQSVLLNVIVDHPTNGVSLLPAALEVLADTAVNTDAGNWNEHPISQLHVIKDFSYPYRNVIYETIRNTYFHVPMWFALMFMFIASVYYSIQYLRNPVAENDRRAVAFTETGLLFGFLGLVTGMLWAHYAWGKAWSNDIKQLMTAVALLVYLAYFILRASFDEPEKGARLAAVYNIFAFSSLVPLLYIIPRMFASLHPGATGNPAFGSEDLDNTMRLVFYPSIIGFTMLGVWMAQIRYRSLRLRDRLADID
ncbi:MAG: cytochrome c biogenesis protein CcsA [Saprospiraceae bacterium]|nr:cytochrome c biogenesis protein CcsA [Saprospiraceae bacterium]